jgi:hypothetical protein
MSELTMADFIRLPTTGMSTVTVHDHSPPPIIAAAILGHDGQIVALQKPCRHQHIISYMVTELGHPAPIDGRQGFLTLDGKFVNRVVAKHCAVMNKQLLPRAMDLKDLYSEDVW